MATGHILPGYGDPVTRLRRARSAGCYPLDTSSLLELQNKARASKRELDAIRENAKSVWLQDLTSQTHYDTVFSGGEAIENTKPRTPRPTSSCRHNNPHPPQVFLTNRLHYIEGYQNPDATLGKSVYQNKERVMDAIKENDELTQDLSYGNRPNTSFPSLHRWMKNSGSDEYTATNMAMKNLRTDPLGQSRSYMSVGQKHQNDIHSAGMFRFQPTLRRGEYSMHPDWPTSLPHHRVP